MVWWRVLEQAVEDEGADGDSDAWGDALAVEAGEDVAGCGLDGGVKHRAAGVGWSA